MSTHSVRACARACTGARIDAPPALRLRGGGLPPHAAWVVGEDAKGAGEGAGDGARMSRRSPSAGCLW